ncbi:hypothetical protein KP509_10G046600 [Ceratopteris richardii]|uniref:Uncharacterized protein n=1 Tax=Ceratopteris richardii TaxID=49495 RepID=A0A8T2TX47_CERRI|nr:hypothetical protein KP509_10G046600 [Ceratopteris richardii]
MIQYSYPISTKALKMFLKRRMQTSFQSIDPMLWKDVCIRTCDTCNRSKVPRHKPHGILQPLPIPERPWASLSMDFITDLPKSDKYDVILVIVDRFTKMAHFIPTTKAITCAATARLFLSLCKLLGVQVKLSTANHPKTDGQTERVNQVLEQYLRCTSNYHQNDWFELLPFAEFAYNNSVHASTKQTPFFANYGQHPRMDIQLSNHVKNPAARDKAQYLMDIHKELKEEIQKAQEQYKYYGDQHRVQNPSYQIGDKVWLLRNNLQTSRPCAKLDHQRFGPFTILAKINPVTFKLQLPSTMRIHPVFHISMLEPYQISPLRGERPSPSPPIEIDDHKEFEVEHVLDSRISRGRLEYLIHWKGYDISDRTWNLQKTFREHQSRFKNSIREIQQRRDQITCPLLVELVA